MAEEADEWMKLPVEDKVVHKIWKARVSLQCQCLFIDKIYFFVVFIVKWI